MNWSVRLTVVACGLAAGLGLGGCTPTSGKTWGAGGGPVTLNDKGSNIGYALGRLTRDDSVYFVIVGNGCTGVTFSGGEGTHQGYLRARDTSKTDWSCQTKDGRSGKVVIEGSEFELSSGALFLVFAKEKPARVEQVAVDAKQLQACADAKRFPELGKADPRVAAFLESCKVSE